MEKRKIAALEKCYSIAPLTYKGEQHILVAAEKTDRCILFDANGNEKDTVWTEPGGVMTMVQVPGTDGQFLATHQFYSPNDSKNAKIVIVTPENGKWEVRTLVDLPFVHRFDILKSGEKNYLIACTLKSGHEHKDDWSMPGKVYVAELPEDLSKFDQEHPLKLSVIKEGMLKNHGYAKVVENEKEKALVCSDNGVYLFSPPDSERDNWEEKELLNTPASDALLIDLDQDGEKELLVLSPFHGDKLEIYKNEDGYKKVYEYPEKMEFLHAIWGCEIQGTPVALIGHRKGARKLIKLYWNTEENTYTFSTIDDNCGPANVFKYKNNNKDIIIAANRETDEVAMYTI